MDLIANLAPQQGRNNDRHRMTKHMTHDGRTHERKKLTLEEVNQIKPEVSKEVNQVKIMNVHEYASNRCPLCLTNCPERTIYKLLI